MKLTAKPVLKFSVWGFKQEQSKSVQLQTVSRERAAKSWCQAKYHNTVQRSLGTNYTIWAESSCAVCKETV